MKLPIFIILIFQIFQPIQLAAQNEDSQWIFNWSNIDDCDTSITNSELWGASILDFNSIPPSFYKEKELSLDFAATNTSICDSNGDLLFYSNGQSIHGKNHTPIINGDTINYSPKWDLLTFENELGVTKPSGMRYSQLAGIFAIPNSDSLYYALYQNYENSELGIFELWKSVIKKNDAGEFEVVEKDIKINDHISVPGNVHSCTHANGRDAWLLQFNNDTVYTYLISPIGINLEKVQLLPFTLRQTNGQSKFSKQGDKFALHGLYESQSFNGADLMISDFDRCTGTLVDPKYFQISSMDGSGMSTAVEFSEDGNLIYINRGLQLLQYDLNATNFIESSIIVSEINNSACSLGGTLISFGQMNLGIDNKIYISTATQCFQIHRIDSPNRRGLECNVVKNAIILPTYFVGTMPNLNTYKLGPIDDSPCDTVGLDNNPIAKFWYEQDSSNHQLIQFQDISFFRPEAWAWTFGDGESTDEKSPMHEYETNGIYEVCLTVSNENSSNTSCQEIQIGPVSNQNIQREYDVNIFPNPVEDLTRLVFKDYLPQNAQVIISNTSGQKVFSAKVFKECILDLSNLKAEVFLYEIYDGKELIKTGKIVKI